MNLCVMWTKLSTYWRLAGLASIVGCVKYGLLAASPIESPSHDMEAPFVGTVFFCFYAFAWLMLSLFCFAFAAFIDRKLPEIPKDASESLSEADDFHWKVTDDEVS